MAFLKIFSGKTPEELEQKADAFCENGAYGEAKVEYEKALDKLDKLQNKTGEQPELKQRLEEKLYQSKEALALEHKKSGEDLIEAGNWRDAEEVLRLGLELTEDPDLKSDIEKRLQKGLTPYSDAEIENIAEIELPSVDDQTEPFQEQDDEYFSVLCSTLPEDQQKAYHQYGDAFKTGFVALNQGDFELAVAQLTQALEQESTPKSYIPLELAKAHMNLGNDEKAKSLLEGFLKDYPDTLIAYQLLCEIFWDNGAFDQAQQFIDTCPQEVRDSLIGHLLRGETLFQAKKYPQAESFYLDYLQSHGWEENIVRSLAKTYEAREEKDKARDLYGQIMQTCQGCGSRLDPYIKQRFAETSFETGQYTTQVLELYLSLAQEDPYNRVGYYQKISRIYASLGNEKESRRFLAFAQQLDHGDVE